MPVADSSPAPPRETRIRLRGAFSLARSLAPLQHGSGDPTTAVTASTLRRATRTPDGPASFELEHHGDEVLVRAWGPGADRTLDRVPDLLGARDDRRSWRPSLHPLVAELDRRLPGLRMVATSAVLETAVPTVCEQRVTAREALRAWRRLVRAWGEPAPGPHGLLLPPPPQTLARMAYHRYHPFGLERRRADTIRALASRAVRLEEALELPPGDRRRRLEAFPGVGPWTSSEVAHVAWADADAVRVGDYHVAPCVVYAMTGYRGGDDDAMLELLEPFRPHRARAARLIMLSGIRPAPRAPGLPLRDFRRF